LEWKRNTDSEGAGFSVAQAGADRGADSAAMAD
jgi:hypothetical protein